MIQNIHSYLMPTYGEREIEFIRGEGAYLFSSKNTKYLDFGSGIAVNSLGHCHPSLVKALRDQSSKLWHTSNLYLNKNQEEYAELLCKHSFAEKVFFTNSGVESIECGLKVIRSFHYHHNNIEKKNIISFEGAFHGRTLAALFAANNPKHTEGFGPKVDGFDQVPFADHEAIKRTINKNTAAILLETIQGDGGIKVVPDVCLKGLREICDEHNLLLILDEVQCGVGRTGNFFAFEKSGIVPDIVPIAKGIGGGFPLGACLVTKKVSVGMTPGTHGSTFGGNPLAMSVGNAVLDIIFGKDFLENVKQKGKYFDQGLNKMKDKYPKIIAEIRGAGLIKGLKMLVDNTEFIKRLMNHKMLAIKAEENVTRLFPPLIVNNKELDEAIEKIDKVCKEMS